MIVYATHITPRLRYIAGFIGQEITGNPAQFTGNADEFSRYPGPRINYSADVVLENSIWIRPHGLLTETGIREQAIDLFEWGGQSVFFRTGGDMPFDVFSAAFYLLSRYEEYGPHRTDAYGRYHHENSLAFRAGFLQDPLVNTWIGWLRRAVAQQFPGYPLREPAFSFIPTYDIDEAWCYRHKDWRRSAGGALRDLARFDLRSFRLRRQVLNGKAPDPYDAFAWMDDLHRPYGVHPRYFFLVAAQNGKYDKHILPSETALQTLVRHHAEKYATGIHPSWQSGDDPSLLPKEVEALARIGGKKVTVSRQHYIRMRFPETYRRLMEAGITEDHSMGYGLVNGFRASVATPFYWYDLERETSTHLLLYPFCFMEANSFFEQKQSAAETLEEMRRYLRAVKEVRGTLVTLWHNTFLGTANWNAGWREIYYTFFHEAVAAMHSP